MRIPILMTERLTLRPYRPDDIDDFVQLNASAVVRRHIGGPIEPERVVRLFQAFLTDERDSDDDVWAVTLTATGEYAGHCWIHRPEVADSPDIGFIIKPTLWRRGYAIELVRRMVEHALTDVARRQVTATVDVDHIASIRVLERVGFVRASQADDEDGPHFVYHFDRDFIC